MEQLAVAGLDVEPHLGDPVLELGGSDLADVYPRDDRGLALPRGYRLGRFELGIDRIELLAESRDPARQGGLLVRQDDQQRHDRQQDHQRDRDEVLGVVLYRPGELVHGVYTTGLAGPGPAAGPLRLGTSWV